jgi:hypothetical protein
MRLASPLIPRCATDSNRGKQEVNIKMLLSQDLRKLTLKTPYVGASVFVLTASSVRA